MGYNTASDNELVDSCQKDDVSAYNESFDKYVSKLYRGGMRYLKDETVVGTF